MNTRQLVYLAMFTAIVFVSVYLSQLPIFSSTGGLVHLGNIALFSIALKYGKKFGAVSGGVGMALFDLFSGGAWMVWAPGSLVVRFLMGYAVGKISEDNGKQGTNFTKNILAIIAGSIIMLVGYYLYESIFLTTFSAALASIVGNLTQLGIGLLALILIKYLPEMDNSVKY